MRLPLKVLGVAAASAAVLIGVCKAVRPKYDRLIASLAALPERPIAGRLIGVPYSPPPSIHRGTTKLISPRMLVTRAQAMEIAIGPAENASQHHERGIAKLLTGDIADAIDDLAIAVGDEPSNAEYWSDLAAARLEQASRDDDGMTLARALADVDRAISLDRNLPEAAFNRAVALRFLGVRAAAAHEYARYLLLDPHSEWSGEILAARLTAPTTTIADDWNRARPIFEVACVRADTPMASEIVRRFPEDVRRWAEGEYLARWGVAHLSGHSEDEERSLLIARIAGDLLERQSGERLLGDAVAAIDRAIGLHDGNTIKILAEAHRDYRTARIAYSRRRIDDAAPMFESLESSFRSAHSPMADVVAYYTANVAYDRSDADRSLDLLEAIELHIPASYAALRAQILWTRSSALLRLRRVYESYSAALAAAASSARLGEVDNAATARASIADILMYLGQQRRSWQIRRSVLADASRLGDPLLIENALHGGARMAAREEDWHIARAMYAVQLALPGALPMVRFAGLSGYALAVSKEEQRALSAAERQDLRAAASKITDRLMREDALDEARVVDAMSLLNDDPSRALLLINETLGYRIQRRRPFDMRRLLVCRARAHRLLRDNTSAIADLKAAVSIVGEEDRTISDSDLRDTFLGSSETAFVELAELLFNTGHITDAWSTIERGRTAALRSWVSNYTSPSLAAPADIAALLPPNVAIVVPVAFSDRTVVLTIGRKLVFSDEFPEGLERVRKAAISFAQAIAEGSPVPRIAETQLYAATIGTARSRIPGATTVIVIPDEVFSSVPYAALRNPITQRYTVEEVAFATAPSLTDYLRCNNRRHPTPQEHRALLVGNPAIDREEFPALSQLPDAENEIHSIAPLYRNVLIYVGEKASLLQFLRKAPDADMIEIAAHAVVNSRDPQLSAIPLVRGRDDLGLLSVDIIRRLRLGNAPIVVLAGCGTAAASKEPTSVRSISLAFVAAGARSVVGSLWDVDDAAGRELVVALHRDLANSVAPAEALRNAQLMMLHSETIRWRSPRFWSSFQVYGSN